MSCRFLLLFALLPGTLSAADDHQAVLLSGRRVGEALELLGRPLSSEASLALAKAASVKEIAALLDPLCLVEITINPESRVKVGAGQAKGQLVEGGWTSFLVKVNNAAGVTAPLAVSSPQALPVANSPLQEVADRWLELAVFRGQPLAPSLSGASIDYRILQLYSRDAGKRAAILKFDVGQGTQDLGFRSEAVLNFHCLPCNDLTFRVFDENGNPTTAAFEIRDGSGRVYPSRAKRLAPDFHFHPQVYRASGESIKLPPGEYLVRCNRGPEYHELQRAITVRDNASEVEFRLKRWVDPAARGWWSGDHHIHAAGCAHYTNPTQGVHASDMMRHCLGEDLKVGANLTWGPCFDYQKQFFTGTEDKVSLYPYILRYDVEVSGFGSHQSGHLCLLRLKEQIYPGGDSKHHWPTLCLNTLRWAKKQGAIVGPAHSGWGLATKSDQLPNFEIPPFNGIGANEYIVDVTHMVPGPDGGPVPAVDFISTVDTPINWELNIWYHTLNVGYRTRISGETDFPCIYGERVGLGRSYVKLDGKLTYDKWCEGIRLGRNYTGDGRSHLMDLNVGGIDVGTRGSEVKLADGGIVPVRLDVAALLDEQPNKTIHNRPYSQKPYWHIERARIGNSREVEVELLLNGWPVQKKRVVADGDIKHLAFELKVDHSSWVAVRILGSSHTNPVWVIVGDAPVRASRRSAQWCLKSVDQCWSQKKRFIAAAEMPDALAAYAHARDAYRKRLEESRFQ
ncbi:MAG: CehA/McbA family metallohydrolase [Verrucomicrobiales bacterium]